VQVADAFGLPELFGVQDCKVVGGADGKVIKHVIRRIHDDQPIFDPCETQHVVHQIGDGTGLPGHHVIARPDGNQVTIGIEEPHFPHPEGRCVGVEFRLHAPRIGANDVTGLDGLPRQFALQGGLGIAWGVVCPVTVTKRDMRDGDRCSRPGGGGDFRLRNIGQKCCRQ